MCKMCKEKLEGYPQYVQHPTAITETTIAETTTIEDKLSEKTTVLEEIELGLFTGFEDTTTLEDKKSLTVFAAIAVVCCNILVVQCAVTVKLTIVYNEHSQFGTLDYLRY